MKALFVFVPFCVSFCWGQSAPAGYTENPDAVIGVVDGTKITLGEIQALTPLLSELYRPVAEKDPMKFLRLLGLFMKASANADAEKLTDQAPYKQGLDFAIMEAKARFWVQKSQLDITVSPEELEAYYNEHKEPFRRIKVSGIKVAFGGAPAEASGSALNASRIPRKVLTEDEAKAKAAKLVAELRSGADFSKMVLTNSDDENSKTKGGDLGVWGMTDNVPDALRSGVLALKEGEVSDPIQQPGGYWIVKAVEVTYTPLAEMKDAIFAQVKQEKANKFLDDLYKSIQVDGPPQGDRPSLDPKK
jgi:parvulin-like peptidyl-prolyl isomerase